MSHYDCKNCGHYEGQDYGWCSKCTPKEYLLFAKTMNSDESRNIMLEGCSRKISRILYILENYNTYKQAIEVYNEHRPAKEEAEELKSEQELKDEIRDELNAFVRSVETYLN